MKHLSIKMHFSLELIKDFIPSQSNNDNQE